MKALLLAAGKGTRLQKLGRMIPKCLVPVQGRPLLSIWIEDCLRGVEEIYINISWKREIIKSFLKFNHYENVKIIEEESPVGTGGTLLHLRSVFEQEKVFLLAHADNLLRLDLEGFTKSHDENKGIMTLMSFSSLTPSSCGIIECDESKRLKSFVEKPLNPKSNLANGAVYLASGEVFGIIDNIEQNGKEFQDISTQLLPELVGLDQLYSYHNNGVHLDIGNPEAVLQAQNDVVIKQSYFDENYGFLEFNERKRLKGVLVEYGLRFD